MGLIGIVKSIVGPLVDQIIKSISPLNITWSEKGINKVVMHQYNNNKYIQKQI